MYCEMLENKLKVIELASWYVECQDVWEWLDGCIDDIESYHPEEENAWSEIDIISGNAYKEMEKAVRALEDYERHRMLVNTGFVVEPWVGARP